MKVSIFLFPLFLLSFATQAQKTICGNEYDTTYPAKITYHYDTGIDSLLKARLKLNKEESTYSGYRIQIYFGSNRSDANKVKSEFLREYGNVKAYMIYQQPYFKIRVGDFRTRLEAQKLFYKLQENDNFKSVFIVQDKISFIDI